MSVRFLVIFIFSAFLFSCSSLHHYQDGNISYINRISASDNGEVISYAGTIHPQGFETLKNLFEQTTKTHGKPPRTLTISSGGGARITGMEMGTWVRANQLDVQVRRRCYSSCANYVFPAGINKIVHHDATLLFHGGVFLEKAQVDAIKRSVKVHPEYQKLIETIYQKAKAKGANVSKEELEEKFIELAPNMVKFTKEKTIGQKIRAKIKEFYQSIGVAHMIGDYGYLQLPNFLAEGYDGYYYSLEDLAYLGVSNIRVRGGDGKWQPDFDKKVFLVERKYFDNWKN